MFEIIPSNFLAAFVQRCRWLGKLGRKVTTLDVASKKRGRTYYSTQSPKRGTHCANGRSFPVNFVSARKGICTRVDVKGNSIGFFRTSASTFSFALPFLDGFRDDRCEIAAACKGVNNARVEWERKSPSLPQTAPRTAAFQRADCKLPL